MTIAAIDIGSNSIKLAIAESSRQGGIRFLRREKEGVRLGHQTLIEERLSREAINRAADTIANELGAMRAEIEAALERPLREMRGMKWGRVTGTSGTILALGTALSDGVATDTQVPTENQPIIVRPKLSKLLRLLEGLRQSD